MSARLKLAVWDVDGTLVDSRAVIFEAAKAVFAFMDLPPPAYDEVRQIVGLSLVEGLRELLPSMPSEDIDRAVAVGGQVILDRRKVGKLPGPGQSVGAQDGRHVFGARGRVKKWVRRAEARRDRL
jgi:beta-phosphoglucomutase-like phosphatase (HAD superfamily)